MVGGRRSGGARERRPGETWPGGLYALRVGGVSTRAACLTDCVGIGCVCVLAARLASWGRQRRCRRRDQATFTSTPHASVLSARRYSALARARTAHTIRRAAGLPYRAKEGEFLCITRVLSWARGPGPRTSGGRLARSTVPAPCSLASAAPGRGARAGPGVWGGGGVCAVSGSPDRTLHSTVVPKLPGAPASAFARI